MNHKYRFVLAMAFSLIASVLFMTQVSLAQSSGESARRQDSFASERQQSLLDSPEGVTLTVRLKDSQRRFRQGEIISVELEFASQSSTPYVASTRSYDRSGRLGIETYHIDRRDGVADPLYDHFNSPGSVFMISRLYTTWPLAKKPFLITQELNEWRRFDHPGRYRLYVTSARITKVRSFGKSISIGGDPVRVTSNIIEFEIMPAEPEWAERKLHQALQTIDSLDRQPDDRDQSDARQSACRVLRFLGTEHAAREMIHRFGGRASPCDQEYYFGIIGSPRRRFVIEEMERQLTAPEQPVSTVFLRALSLLSLNERSTLPPYPEGDAEKIKRWEAQAQKRQDDFDDIKIKCVERLAAAVSRKEAEARAVSLAALLEFQASIPRAKRTEATLRLQEKISVTLPSVFLFLPADTQYSLLSGGWNPIKSDAMLPVVRSIYENPPQTVWPIRETALQRLYELSPDEGRRLILEEMHSPRPRVGIKTLGLLPEIILPEMDDFLAAKLESSETGYEEARVYSSLVARYASANALPRLKAAFANRIGHIACAIQTPIVAYFLRVDPQYGAELLDQALSSRKDTGCYKSELIGVAALYMCPEIERVAVAHLNDSEPEIVSQAAATLGQYGSAAAAESLWRRLEQWHQTWVGRVDELDIQPGVDVSASEAHIEIELVRALGAAREWVLSAKELERLTELCVTEMGRKEAQSLASQADVSQSPLEIAISFNSMDDSIYSITVGQYRVQSLKALRDKLSQYPRGTVFVWKSFNGSESSDHQAFADLKLYLEERGMKLNR
ncbi:MAG: hypothetical protein AB1631_12040 [Acidobacteriota bacterium]